MKKWEVLKSKYAFDNKRMKVIQETVSLPSGKVFDDYFLWEVGDASVIVPITQEGKIILVKQYKHGPKDFTIEFPAGMLNKDEDKETAVKRELQEETGYSAREVRFLGSTINNPSKTRGNVNIFLGIDCIRDKSTNFDETEDIQLLEVTKPELDKLVKEGSFFVNSSLAALYLARDFLNELPS